MHARPNQFNADEIRVSPDVIAYVNRCRSDFRISTSCGGPILLPVKLKPPKPTDIQVPAGDYVIFVSMYQIRYLSTIHMGLIPFFLEDSGDEDIPPV